MPNRKRYDTIALQTRMKDEEFRRRALVLGLILVALSAGGGFFLFTDSGPPPEEKGGASNTASTSGGKDSQVAAAPGANGTLTNTASSTSTETGSATDTEVKPAVVEIQLTRKGTLWVDSEKKNKKLKKTVLTLPPGEHNLKAKMGRKTIKAKVVIEGGEALKVKFNHRKKKASITQVKEDDIATETQSPNKKKRKKGRRKRKRK